MLNNVSLVGRLTREPETKNVGDGKIVSSFTLAVQRTKDIADFIPCEVWGKTAESVRDYVTKGSMIAVEGRIQVETFTDNEDKKRTFTKVVVNRVHFIEIKTTDGGARETGPEHFMTDAERAGL